MSVSNPEYDCPHSGAAEVRRKTTTGGTEHFGIQCQVCGRLVGVWIKKTDPSTRGAKPWDDELNDRWYREHAYAAAERRKLEKNGAFHVDDDWRARYNAHIRSPRWARIKALVHERAGRICEGCRANPSWEIHHRTYEHLGDEFIFELVALCVGCHERFHQEIEARRT